MEKKKKKADRWLGGMNKTTDWVRIINALSAMYHTKRYYLGFFFLSVYY